MLNCSPNDWTINMLIDHIRNGPQTVVRGAQVPARPFGHYSLSWRLRLAVAVFRGHADALFWPDQNPKAY